ncbi:hypothetical protein S40285_05663 [Stachybotrys chlorohalonatus IBT 40285]|uniref:Uncharacterized protein n=1 Tax=Stachybotrys chlorohalonatus (strain IBT 40285) TaxID=1283841 RepID=A0A084QZY7_STAC4|nr:hypothetical protein S40285_05663 [Stachybotrys chlorohalonata IBT 40285]
MAQLSHEQRQDFTSPALAHRVRAINALNSTLSTPCTNHADGDARFVTIMILTFQASYMSEGMHEFLSTIRGCIIVSASTMLAYNESAFRSFLGHQQQVAAQALGGGQSSVVRDTSILSAALDSVAALRPLCKSVLDVKFIAAMEGIFDTAKNSYVQAFGQISSCYNLLGEASSSDFDSFNRSDNHTSRLLLAHFFVIDHELSGVAMQSAERSVPFRRTIVAAWVRQVADKLPPTHCHHIAWPLKFVEAKYEAQGVNIGAEGAVEIKRPPERPTALQGLQSLSVLGSVGPTEPRPTAYLIRSHADWIGRGRRQNLA